MAFEDHKESERINPSPLLGRIAFMCLLLAIAAFVAIFAIIGQIPQFATLLARMSLSFLAISFIISTVAVFRSASKTQSAYISFVISAILIILFVLMSLIARALQDSFT
jgi:hypothetical protein